MLIQRAFYSPCTPFCFRMYSQVNNWGKVIFMNVRIALLLLLPLSLFRGVAAQAKGAQTETSNGSTIPACNVTLPNQSQPPVKDFGGTVIYQDQGQHDGFVKNSHGNGKLWTTLWPDGTVVFRPGDSGFVLPDGALSMKWWWYRGVRGKLTIRGRRLDGTAPPLRARIPGGYGDTGFQSTALIFPSEGCWEVTGEAGNTSLTFVTRVVKITHPTY
jgi:hypothetical protein